MNLMFELNWIKKGDFDLYWRGKIVWFCLGIKLGWDHLGEEVKTLNLSQILLISDQILKL